MLDEALKQGARFRCPLDGRALDHLSKKSGDWGHESSTRPNEYHVINVEEILK